jgi:Ca2+/Na+ antiporter
MNLWQAVLVFLLSAAVLVRAGSSLAGYADQIAERMRMSRPFVGTLMLAFATSLPELVTDITVARAVAAIVGESERTRFRKLEPDAIVLLIIYAATLVAVAYYG